MALLTRRKLIVGATASALIACRKSRDDTGFLARMEQANERVQGALFSPTRLQRRPSDRSVTKEGAFPAYKIADGFSLPPDDWALEVSGMVKSPRTFTLEELMKLPRTDMRVRHHCVEGWSAVSDWHGVQLSELARVVGVDPQCGFVEFNSFEADAEDASLYFSSWDVESALHPQTLIAYGKSGKPLGPEYGGPARLYGSVKLGYKNVKYLQSIVFTPQATGGYWENLGYEWYAGV